MDKIDTSAEAVARAVEELRRGGDAIAKLRTTSFGPNGSTFNYTPNGFKNKMHQEADLIAALSRDLEAMRAERDALQARVAELETNIQVAIDASKTELNLGNYDHDNVCALQAESLDIWTVLTAALAKDVAE